MRAILYVTAIFSTMAFGASAAQGHGLPPRAADPMSVLLSDTILQTSLSTFPADEKRPMQINLRVFARDTSSGPLRGRTLPLARCAFSLRLYRSGSTVPAWSSDRASATNRCPELQPSDTGRTDVTVQWGVPALLGDSLPAGRYAMGYSVRAADGRSFDFAVPTIYLTSDRAPPTHDLSAVRFSAHSAVVDEGPRKLSVVSTLLNTGTRPVSLAFGACNTNIRLYRTADRREPAVWRSDFVAAPGSKLMHVCTTQLYVAVIQPRDSIVLPTIVPLSSVIGDSLAPGRYYVNAELTLMLEDGPPGHDHDIRMLSAGAVDITRAPDRLPRSRVVGGLTFTATTQLVHGADNSDTVRTLMRVVNKSGVRQRASVARDCPVIAYAYRSAALRDSLPLQTPLAYPNPACRLNVLPFMLEPGQSWEFVRDVTAAAVRAAVGPGHLWFTAWWPENPNIMISAGDVDLPPQ